MFFKQAFELVPHSLLPIYKLLFFLYNFLTGFLRYDVPRVRIGTDDKALTSVTVCTFDKDKALTSSLQALSLQAYQ